jgi:hypothetical protein
MPIRSTLTLLGAAAAMIVAAAPAAAAPPSSGLETAGRAVSDSELGDMRGKFIGPNNIAYFGIQMQTSWQGADGITTAATLLLSVNFANGAGNLQGATPLLLIGWTRDGDASADISGLGQAASGSYAAIPIGGLGSVQGAVQSQQIAGSDNNVRNDMRFAIVPISSLQTQTPTGLSSVTAGQNHQFADGDTLRFVVAPNQVGIELGSGTADQVRQSLDGMLGQAGQHVLLSSSNNMVHSQMGITIGYDQLGDASRASLDNALSALQGIGF